MQEPHVDTENDLGTLRSHLRPPVAAALCYLPLFGGVVASIKYLFTEPDNRFVRFHAVQALIFWGVALFTEVPVYLVGIPVLSIGTLVVVAAAWVYLTMQALQGREYRIPLAGDLAAQFSRPRPTAGATDVASDEAEAAERAA
jgi:uncharacterized membrane protein